MKRSRVILGLFLALGVSLIVVCFYQKPQADAAKLTVRFIGFTNDISAGNLAILTLKNTGNSRVMVILPALIELRNTRLNDPGRAVYPTLLSPSSEPLTTTVVIPEFHTEDHWRAAFSYWTLRGKFGRLLRDYAKRLAKHLPTPWAIRVQARMADYSTAHSEWVPLPAQLDKMEFDWMEFGAALNREPTERPPPFL